MDLVGKGDGGSGTGEGKSYNAPWRGAALPLRHQDVTDIVDSTNLDLLNWNGAFGSVKTLFEPTEPSALALTTRTRERAESEMPDWVQSDADDQLILFIPFQASVKIHTIQITSLPSNISDNDEITMRPKTIKFYKNQPNTLNFDDVEAISATDAIELGSRDWDEKTGTAKLELRFVNFQNVTTLVMFIANGDGSGEITRLDRLRIIGSSGAMKDRETIERTSLAPDNYAEPAAQLSDLGIEHLEQHEKTGSSRSLDLAWRFTKQALDSAPENHPDRQRILYNRATCLLCFYKRTDKPEDLNEAISVSRQAVDFARTNHPNRAWALNTHALLLEMRYQKFGELADLEEAVRLAKLAVVGSKNYPGYARLLDNLGNKLLHLYEWKGEIGDLEEAIQVARQAVEVTPEDVMALNNLAYKLARRQDRTGDIQDNEEAIRIAQQAIDLTPKGHPDLARQLVNLANHLRRRYLQSAERHDIDHAIQLLRKAIDSCPKNHQDRASGLHNLGMTLDMRYERTGRIGDLEEAIRVAGEALYLDLTPKNHPGRPGRLRTLGSKFVQRYIHTGHPEETQDLEQAIEASREAIALTPKNHTDQAENFSYLGKQLLLLYLARGDTRDLEKATQWAQQAIDLTPEDHPNQAQILSVLACVSECRYNQTGQERDLDMALDCYLKACRHPQARPLDRVSPARGAIRILKDRNDWDQAVSLAKESTKLFSLLCGRYSVHEDQQYAALQVSGLAADACSIILKKGDVTAALQQLELGRGLMLGYMMDSRSDLSALKNDYPALAEEYEKLRIKAYTQIEGGTPVFRDKLARERREAARDIEECLLRIRQQPHYERFLLGSSIEELKSHAAEGPIVVVNITDIGADAIILSQKRIQSLSLPELSRQKAPKFIREDFDRFALSRSGGCRVVPKESEAHRKPDNLQWLWSNCVKLILDELKSMDLSVSAGVPRVWWIGSGIASYFPFHAAGSFLDGLAENALDRVVSSYTPTIKALAYSRSANSSRAINNKNASILVVTMPTTPGHKSLSGVDREKAAIEQACKGTFSCDELRLPTADQVLERIPQSDITHFACHGASDRTNPLESYLLLQKGEKEKLVVDRLTVSRISRVPTQRRRWIAFLSACSTAEVKATELADEALHLASAFQLVSFTHVIGSLWSADDDVCTRMAELFYSDLCQKCQTGISDYIVSSALRNAVLQIRSVFPRNPELWAQFVHFGT